MTVQCPTVISDANKSVSNYRFSSIFTIFPVLNRHFLLKPPVMIFRLIYPPIDFAVQRKLCSTITYVSYTKLQKTASEMALKAATCPAGSKEH